MNSTDSIYYGASKEDILRHYPSGDFRYLKDKVSKTHTFGYYLKMKEGSRRRDFTGLVDKTSDSSMSLVYAMISMLSGFGLMAFLANRKKKEE